jgi:hypothetical protein
VVENRAVRNITTADLDRASKSRLDPENAGCCGVLLIEGDEPDLIWFGGRLYYPPTGGEPS